MSPGAVTAVQRSRCRHDIFSTHSSSPLISVRPTENRDGFPDAVCDGFSERVRSATSASGAQGLPDRPTDPAQLDVRPRNEILVADQ